MYIYIYYIHNIHTGNCVGDINIDALNGDNGVLTTYSVFGKLFFRVILLYKI